MAIRKTDRYALHSLSKEEDMFSFPKTGGRCFVPFFCAFLLSTLSDSALRCSFVSLSAFAFCCSSILRLRRWNDLCLCFPPLYSIWDWNDGGDRAYVYRRNTRSLNCCIIWGLTTGWSWQLQRNSGLCRHLCSFLAMNICSGINSMWLALGTPIVFFLTYLLWYSSALQRENKNVNRTLTKYSFKWYITLRDWFFPLLLPLDMWNTNEVFATMFFDFLLYFLYWAFWTAVFCIHSLFLIKNTKKYFFRQSMKLQSPNYRWSIWGTGWY